MGGVKVVIKKMMTFKGVDEEFTNVYYFGNGGLASVGGTQAADLINKLITAEQVISANAIRFLGGSAYQLNAFDKPESEPVATVEKPAGVLGQASTSTLMYAECAIDVRLILTGRRILRTLIHTRNPWGLSVTGETPATPQQAVQTFASDFLLPDFKATGLRRISPSGQVPSATLLPQYLEHRQFHRYRRRN
jgi:hypothetical protein